MSRTYQSREEDGFIYPAESQKLTLKASDLIDRFTQASAELFDLAATQDSANTEAKASIVIDGQTIITDAPVSYLAPYIDFCKPTLVRREFKSRPLLIYLQR